MVSTIRPDVLSLFDLAMASPFPWDTVIYLGIDEEGEEQQGGTENDEYDANFIPEARRGDEFMKKSDNHLPMQDDMQYEEG
jgi:hypothetical protein